MTLAAAGMLDAFSELVRRHEQALRRFCARMLGAPDVGDDVAQDVFLEIWRTCGRYEGRGHFRAFAFTTARNRCLNEIRARRAPADDSAQPPALAEAGAPASADQVEELLAAERRQHLDRLVSRLPPKLRDAIWLRYSADLDFAEIAAIVKRSEDTVRGRVFRGLKRLRALLDDARERSQP